MATLLSIPILIKLHACFVPSCRKESRLRRRRFRFCQVFVETVFGERDQTFCRRLHKLLLLINLRCYLVIYGHPARKEV